MQQSQLIHVNGNQRLPGLATASGSSPCSLSCSPAGFITCGGYPSAHTWAPTPTSPSPRGMGSSDTSGGMSTAFMAHMPASAGNQAGDNNPRWCSHQDQCTHALNMSRCMCFHTSLQDMYTRTFTHLHYGEALELHTSRQSDLHVRETHTPLWLWLLTNCRQHQKQDYQHHSQRAVPVKSLVATSICLSLTCQLESAQCSGNDSIVIIDCMWVQLSQASGRDCFATTG
jgi:hypothetical protein